MQKRSDERLAGLASMQVRACAGRWGAPSILRRHPVQAAVVAFAAGLVLFAAACGSVRGTGRPLLEEAPPKTAAVQGASTMER
jgi:hypothetical protein